MKFKDLLKAYRENKGLKKTDLAHKIRVSPEYMMNVESGYQKAPTLERVNKIADVLELSDHDRLELLKVATLERMSGDERLLIEKLLSEKHVTTPKFSHDVLEALHDPVAVKALLVTHKNSEDIKMAIRHMLDCFPSLSPDKRQAILALCK